MPPLSGARMRVSIEGRDASEPVLRNGKAVGSYAVVEPAAVTRVELFVEGPWQLVRLEWFPAK